MESLSFIGDTVEIECGVKGIYKGTVSDIDTKLQEIGIRDVSLNGAPLAVSSIRVRSDDIDDLRILKKHVPTKKKQTIQPEEAEPKSKKKEFTEKREQKYRNSPELQQSGKKYQTGKEKTSRKQNRNEQALGNDSDQYKTDFDFERNLALFDKKAVFEELKESITQGLTKSVVRNYKGNENILESEPVSLRQIQVPLEHVGKEYTTDNGFIVPAISSELRKKLFSEAEQAGLSVTQRVENVGICTCQMALQLAGGESRICPKNAHQAPDVVVLAGPHLDGLQAISAARHLANHTVNVTLFVPEIVPFLQSQVELFKKTQGKMITTVQELPSQPVDLVIDALSNSDNNETQYHWLPWVIEWANHNKAPVLALDPCIRSSKPVNIVIKWSIALALPLIGSLKSGRLYIADVGIPTGVFKDVGISYKSPFGDKFVIPLYD